MAKKKVEFHYDWDKPANKSKDLKMIGTLFTIKDEDEIEIKARLIDIKPPEGYYVFDVTTKASELEGISCRYPNEMMEVYK